ncbi:MAG: hypothetical protein ACOY0S_04510 [Patescibacteria group bacterium]
MAMLWSIVVLILTLFLSPSSSAFYNPASVPNNKYGIHVADPNDIPATAALVNSQGGDWGYVTVVVQETDRDPGKWQKIFNEMRRLHLVPLVRLATHVEGNAWAKPKLDSLPEWVNFLGQLNWPTENRYVILFNEPNHAKEWGNTLDPEGYAEILVKFATTFKQKSEDFFVLPAGLDASADGNGETMDAAVFLKRIVASQPDFLNLIDGWISHSYPNPGFSGSPRARGRGTLRTYQWELAYLSELGNQKRLPVFITETGWMHSQGKIFNPLLLAPEAVAGNLTLAAATVWPDPRVVAVTPFVFNYQDLPFDHFSWKTLGGDNYYPPYFAYQAIPKVKGRPRQRLEFKLSSALFPATLVASSSYTLTTKIKNLGQGILDPVDDYRLTVEAKPNFNWVVERLPTLEPGEEGEITIHLTTAAPPGTYNFRVQLEHGETSLILEDAQVVLVPPPTIAVKAQLGWRKSNTASDVTVLVYDGDRLLLKFTGLTLTDGQIEVSGISDIIPGERYRVVVLVPYYLPRQTILPLASGRTVVAFKRFLPLDFNLDGRLDVADLLALIKLKPNFVLQLFLGP